MEKLIKLFKEYSQKKQSLFFAVGWTKCGDWSIYIEHKDSKTIIFNDSDFSLELVAANAFVSLAKWGEEFEDLENILYNIF